MVLLDELISATDEDAHCRITIREDGVFYDRRRKAVPAWVGIEMMAQAVAAWAGYKSWKKGDPAPIGFLLGTRRYEAAAAEFSDGEMLDIYVHRDMESSGMAVFSCRIESGGDVLASCLLNVFRPPPDQLDAMLKKGAA